MFRGHGWGHGLGMSQYGAQGAARLGCAYRRILRTYYTGTRVTPAAMPATVNVRMTENVRRASVTRGDPVRSCGATASGSCSSSAAAG